MAKRILEVRLKTILFAALVGGLLLTSGRTLGPVPVVALTWFLACLAAEALWHRALDGVTPLSMAPAAHMAAVAGLPVFWGVPVVVMAVGLGVFLWRRGGVRDAVSGMVAATVGGGMALIVLVLGGAKVPATGSEELALFRLHEPLQFVLLFLAGAHFLLFHQAVTALAGARVRRLPADRVWREAFGHETELIMSGALVTVAVLALFCYQALGFRGILLCVMPILFVRDGSRRSIELDAAQAKLINNERLAAKGEMAAEIGHELNNYLAAISGRAQLLLRGLKGKGEKLVEDADAIHTLAGTMAELARGLMDFSHREMKRRCFGVNELVERTVEFVRPQTRFEALEFRFEPDHEVPPVDMDPGQIQQVLLTLFGRVADLPRPGSPSKLTIRTFNNRRRSEVGIEISFAPARVGAPDGEPGDPGWALGTVRRIVERHQGRFEVVVDSSDGEAYRVLLPAA